MLLINPLFCLCARPALQEQSAALQALSMSDYSSLKSRLLLTTALLTLGGSGVAVLASGVDAAVPFALGGMAGLLYQLLLQVGADAAVGTAAARLDAPAAAQPSRGAAAIASMQDQQSFQGPVLKVLGSPAVRLALLMSAALLAVWALQDSSGECCAGAGDANHAVAVECVGWL